MRDVNLARAHQLGHLPEKERKQQSTNVRAIDVCIGHDNDTAVTQLGNIETTFLFAVTILFRFADAGADSRNHRLDLIVLKKLILARFFHVYQFSANRQNGLITPVASLFGGASR